MKDTLPSTVNFTPEAARTEVTSYVLVVVSDAGVAQLALEPGRVVQIGRRASSDVVIDHPAASRAHAVLYATEPPEIEDLGSFNGTHVQGQRIAPATRVPLPVGSVASVAGVSLFVRDASSDVRGPRADTRPVPAAGGNVRGLVLRDEKMQELMSVMARLAQSAMPVLILGETGVGKEILADKLHQLSPRRDRPMLRINCAALAEGILASELFGHERGAFTGAHASKVGLFESANGGTVFLDEVGELSPETQAKLLRVLETGEVIRVGSHQSRQVDVRVVSATNRDLRQLVAEGRFRADLYYRLNGVLVQVPPLRERHADILPLAEYFAARSADRMATAPPIISEAARAALIRHRWPGNVRELKHVIERAVVLAHGPILEASALQFDPALPSVNPGPSSGQDVLRSFESTRPEGGRAHESVRLSDSQLDRAPRSSRSPTSNSRLRAARRAELLRAELQRAERERILEALQQAGNQADAARLLGISRRALLYRLDAFDIPRPRKGRGKAP
ncbi:MAG TPA: sigma 54-interacting transcriptional regulator [Polyangiaceae bacterium]